MGDHKKMKTNKAQAGFSLVELMVVVAIIGILSTIAIPNFQRFQARAKQSNAKTELSSIYTAQKGFSAEYNTFHNNMCYTGFVPDGVTATTGAVMTGVVRYYATGFNAAGVTGAVTGYAVPASCDPAGGNIVYKDQPPGVTALGAVSAGSLSQTAFTASAEGKVVSTNTDKWTINDSKVLTNTTSGI